MATLENITVFLRAVETMSFSAAGRALRLTPAVVSHRIQSLEKHLGCRLFNRTTRQIQLTEQGRVFYEKCLEIRDAVERAESSIAEIGAHPRGTLKVTAPLGLGRRIIAPLVPKFREEYPEIDVRLRLSDHLLDLLTESVDLAVRLAPMADSSLILRKIADVRRVFVASPSYLEKQGAPKTPEDLLQHNCLLLRFPGSTQFRWSVMKDNSPLNLAVSGHCDADDGDILTQWAIAGEGIALKPFFEVAQEMREGKLIEILPATPPTPVALGVLYPYQRMVPLKVKAFADRVIEATRSFILHQTRENIK
jgi:DNA-binding transcriptional LysR family regulator